MTYKSVGHYDHEHYMVGNENIMAMRYRGRLNMDIV